MRVGAVLWVLSGVAIPVSLSPQVYKSIDKDGNVTFTNAPTQAGAQLQAGSAAAAPVAVSGGVLSAAGTDPNAHDGRGDTPLHEAVFFDKEALTRSLIARGANVKAANVYGDTPLHTAAAFNRSATARILIAAGARLDAENLEGQTPLHTAVGARAVDMVALLLDNHAPVNVVDRHNRTALDMVLSDKTSELALLLKRHGAYRASPSRDDPAPPSTTTNIVPSVVLGGATHLTTYEYDDHGNRTTMTRDGTTTTYEYNDDNQLLRVVPGQ